MDPKCSKTRYRWQRIFQLPPSVLGGGNAQVFEAAEAMVRWASQCFHKSRILIRASAHFFFFLSIHSFTSRSSKCISPALVVVPCTFSGLDVTAASIVLQGEPQLRNKNPPFLYHILPMKYIHHLIHSSTPIGPAKAARPSDTPNRPQHGVLLILETQCL